MLSYSVKRGIQLRKIVYTKLWKLLIDKKMNKNMLAKQAGISQSSLTKLMKDENVHVAVLVKICNALECEMQDIHELVSE